MSNGIEGLGLSDRDSSLLTQNNISTVDELLKLDRGQLIELEGIGEVTADRILAAVSAWKLTSKDAGESDRFLAEYDEATEAAAAKPLADKKPTATSSEDTANSTETIQQLTEALCWAMLVFTRQTRGQQGQHLAGLLRQNLMAIRPELSAEEIEKLPAKLVV